MADLLGSVHGLGLPHGVENSFEAKLEGAGESLERGQPAVAVNKLGALLSQIAALGGKKLSTADAAGLTAEVEATVRALGCLE